MPMDQDLRPIEAHDQFVGREAGPVTLRVSHGLETEDRGHSPPPTVSLGIPGRARDDRANPVQRASSAAQVRPADEAGPIARW